MKKVTYNLIDDAPKDTYFAAVNSGGGFLSYFPQVFGSDKIKKRYVIKGGPGTGKSSFMRRVAEYAEACGRRVEYYRCSSDPASLDGIVIDRVCALLDGTAPHVYEPKLIGVQDHIVNLCQFWDGEQLEKRRGDIVSLTTLRSGEYRKAYGYLSAASGLNEINDSIASSALDTEKMGAAAGRILRQIDDGESFMLEYRIVNAVGMSGFTHLSSFEKKASRLYAIVDSYELSWRFLSAVIEGAAEKRVRVQVSYDPIEPHKPDGVYFPMDKTALIICHGDIPEGATVINMARFVMGDRLQGVKAEYRYNRRLRDALLGAAEDALGRAGKYHFQLEDMYKECMDFDSERVFTEKFCREALK